MYVDTADETALPAVNAMTRACIAHMLAAGIDQWDEIYPDPATFQRDALEKNLLLLKNNAHHLIGCASLDQRQSPEYLPVSWTFDAPSIGVVHRLMIAPPHRGQGFAKTLMHLVEQRAHHRGYQVLRLDAFRENPPALQLYAALGYRRAGEVCFRKGVFICFEKQLRPAPMMPS
jgi:RimJ/RimL family protein N-acetyltransferase